MVAKEVLLPIARPGRQLQLTGIVVLILSGVGTAAKAVAD